MFFFFTLTLFPSPSIKVCLNPPHQQVEKLQVNLFFFLFFYLWLTFCLKCWCYFCIEIMMLDKCIEDVLTNMSFFFYFSLWLCLKCWYYFCIEIMMLNKCIKEVITNISLKKKHVIMILFKMLMFFLY
jgi:hypothetical protein